jgi:hypothetical protein
MFAPVGSLTLIVTALVAVCCAHTGNNQRRHYEQPTPYSLCAHGGSIAQKNNSVSIADVFPRRLRCALKLFIPTSVV